MSGTSSSRRSGRWGSTGRSAWDWSLRLPPAKSSSARWERLNGVDPESHALSLQQALHSELTLGGAAALLIFFAFAMQCTSTLAVVRRETNSWKWPAIQFTYMTVLAYVSALATNVIVTRFFG